MAKSADLHIRISPSTLKRIQKLAKLESRTQSSCAARLLDEALDLRVLAGAVLGPR